MIGVPWMPQDMTPLCWQFWQQQNYRLLRAAGVAHDCANHMTWNRAIEHLMPLLDRRWSSTSACMVVSFRMTPP